MKHRCPFATKSYKAKTSKSYILTPVPPRDRTDVSLLEKREKDLGEYTVQVWSLYRHPDLRYCTFKLIGTKLRTNRHGRTIQPDVPGGPFRRGHNKYGCLYLLRDAPTNRTKHFIF